MRRFQYFIDLDRTVRIDDKGNGDPSGNTPWPKLFGIFNSFCNISLKRCKIIRLALFKAGQGNYFRDIGETYSIVCREGTFSPLSVAG